MDDERLPVELGRLLDGKYRVESVLGRGGMGVVLAATHVGLERRVAIEFLLDDASVPGARERFAREARAASKIRSEHVVRILDVGALDSGVPYMVMEHLAGEDLAKRLHRAGPLHFVEAVGYVLQACEALAEAHRAGIVHRDLKPSNVFLARRADGSIAAKVLDFGVSKFVVTGASGVITNASTLLGSPTYMPPEQIRSVHNVDLRGDLWSLGATLFHLIAGRGPFGGATLPELCVRILEEPAPKLETFAPNTPPGLSAVIDRCLAKLPGARFSNVAELASALEPFGPPEGRVSVERVARIVSAQADDSPGSVSDSDVIRLHEAATVKSGVLQGALPSGESAHVRLGLDTAHAVVSSTAPAGRAARRGWVVSAGVVALIASLGGVVLLRRSPLTPASPVQVLATTPLALQGGPTTALASAPPLESLSERPPAASAAPVEPPSRAAAPRQVPLARRVPRALPVPSAAPPPVAAETRPPARALAARSGTEGFGDRK